MDKIDLTLGSIVISVILSPILGIGGFILGSIYGWSIWAIVMIIGIILFGYAIIAIETVTSVGYRV